MGTTTRKRLLAASAGLFAALVLLYFVMAVIALVRGDGVRVAWYFAASVTLAGVGLMYRALARRQD